MAVDNPVDKFLGATKALGEKMFFRSDLLKTSNKLMIEGNKNSEKQITLLEELVSISQSTLDFLKDQAEDKAREEDLTPTEPKPTPETGDDLTSKIEPESLFDKGAFSVLSGFALAPFIFRFAKGFVTGITDGLVDLTMTGMAGISIMLRGPFDDLVKSVTKALTYVDDLAKAGSHIAGIFGRFAGLVGEVGSFIGRIFGAIPGVGVLKNLLGRLAWPFTIVIGAIEAVKSFMDSEGSFIERFGAGVGGFFAEVVGAPLDLIKGVVSWVLDMFGFENAAKFLQGFSFGDIIRNIASGMFGALDDVVDGVVAIFKGNLSGISQMFSGIVDLVLSPINAAINFVQGIFGWGDPNEPFRFSTWITGIINDAWNWVSGLFTLPDFSALIGDRTLSQVFDDAWEKISEWFTNAFSFLPSLQDIKDALVNMLPSWLRPESQDEERARLLAQIDEETAKITASEAGENVYWGSDETGREKSRLAIEEARMRLSELDAINNEIAGLRKGGIVSAPDTGGLAILHGTEAVIPLDSPKAMNKIKAVAEGSARMASAMFNNISPTTINSGGNMSNSNNSNTTIINHTLDTYRSLDPALPR